MNELKVNYEWIKKNLQMNSNWTKSYVSDGDAHQC
jgi:hypothetical protein